MKRNFLPGVVLFLLLFSSTAGFASSSFWPTREEWQQSFMCAIRSPVTWVPIIGAGIVAATNTDKRISNWAYENNPVFGSPQRAKRASDNLNWALGTLSVGTLLLMPERDEDKSWLVEKGEYFLVMSGSVGAAAGTTALLKQLVARGRPHGHNHESFPSGHTTAAFALAAVTTENLNTFCWSPPSHIIANTGVYLLAAGVGWARIEGGAHWPTDVLVAAGLANFITSFIYGAFIHKPPNDQVNISFVPLREGGIAMQFDKSF